MCKKTSFLITCLTIFCSAALIGQNLYQLRNIDFDSYRHAGLSNINNLRSDPGTVFGIQHHSALTGYDQAPRSISGFFKTRLSNNQPFSLNAGVNMINDRLGAFNQNRLGLQLGSFYHINQWQVSLALGGEYISSGFIASSLNSIDPEDFTAVLPAQNEHLALTAGIQSIYTLNDRLSFIAAHSWYRQFANEVPLFEENYHFSLLGWSWLWGKVEWQSQINARFSDYFDPQIVYHNRFVFTDFVGFGLGIGNNNYMAYECRLMLRKWMPGDLQLFFEYIGFNGNIVRAAASQNAGILAYF